jgi:hypothetical protein
MIKSASACLGKTGGEDMPRIGDHRNLPQVNQQPRANATSAPRKRAWRSGVKPTLANGKPVELRKVRIGGLAAGQGLSALARNKLGHAEVLQQLIKAHQQFKKDAAESLVLSLEEMSNRQLLLVYRNLNDNSSILSRISQTHSNPAELRDFAEAVFSLVTNTVRQKGMEADDIKPERFDLSASENQTILETLRAREAAQNIPVLSGKPDPKGLLHLFQEHAAICSSTEFWSYPDVYRHYEPLGLLVAISELQRLKAKDDPIDANDVKAIRNALKTAPHFNLPDEFEQRLTELDTSDDLVLFNLAKVVADYYVELRESDDAFTFGMSSLLNLQGGHRAGMEDLLKGAYATKDAGRLIEGLEKGFADFVKTNGVVKSWVVEPLAALARGEAPPPPEKLDEAFMIMTGKYTPV